MNKAIKFITVLVLSVMAQSTHAAENNLPPIPMKDSYKVAMIVYDNFTPLDLMGPSEIFAVNQTRFRQVVVGLESKAKVPALTKGFTYETAMSFAEAAALEGKEKFDILVLPGSTYGQEVAFNNPKFIEDFKKLADKVDLVFSVCTGASILAKAGYLDDKKATITKLVFSRYEKMFPKVNWVRKARYVHDQGGKFLSSSGVTAGVDAALYVAERAFGKSFAEEISHGLEFQATPNPDDDPFADYFLQHPVDVPEAAFLPPSE